jgi:hypothetical protein
MMNGFELELPPDCDDPTELLFEVVTELLVEETVECGGPLSRTPAPAAPTTTTAITTSSNTDVRFVSRHRPPAEVKLLRHCGARRPRPGQTTHFMRGEE